MGKEQIPNMSNKPQIIVTKHGLVVDGREVQTRNRWEAKREAARLSEERGTPWFNLKSNGKLVEVK